MRNTYIVLIVIIILLIVGAVYLTNREAASPLSNVLNNTLNNATNTPDQIDPGFNIMSTAFENGESIPSKYTCDGTNVNPPLSINNAPTTTQSFALIMHDPDIPKNLRASGVFNHWVLYNIPATTTMLEEGTTIGVKGVNDANRQGFMGSCPPPQYEPKEHRYIFTLYALDNMLTLKAGATRAQVEAAIKDHIVGQTELVGRYQRVSTSSATTTR
jgi:Raf kinase inhibitor-like YbhB/YbcL family protein